jgi:hypothetical protein
MTAWVELADRDHLVLDPESVQGALDQLDHRRFRHALLLTGWPRSSAKRTRAGIGQRARGG